MRLNGNQQSCAGKDRDSENQKAIDGCKFSNGTHSKTFPSEA